jgi:hypothetical protein
VNAYGILTLSNATITIFNAKPAEHAVVRYSCKLVATEVLSDDTDLGPAVNASGLKTTQG